MRFAGCFTALTFLGLLVQIDCSDLKALFVIFRHGNRAPYAFYQNDPHGNLETWPNGLAQLSKVGEQQTTKIGEFLAKIYLDLEVKNISQIDLKSISDMNRISQSAENVFKAFVANRQLEKSSPIILFERELTIRGPWYCPAYDEELERLANQPVHREIIRRNEEIFRNLISQHNITFADDVKALLLSNGGALHQLVDTFQFELNEGLELPSWLTPELHEQLRWLAGEYYNRWCSSKRMVRLVAGPILEDFSNKIQKLVKPKIHSQLYDFLAVNAGPKPTKILSLYGCDDITLNNLLVGLQAFDPVKHLPPPPAGTVIIELHQAADRPDLAWDESSFVRVLYFNETVYPIMSEPYILQNVTVRTFFSSIAGVSMNDNEWLKLCLDTADSSGAHPDACSDRTALLVIIVVLAVLVALLLITLCICRRNRSKNL